VHLELHTSDHVRASTFYARLLHWRAQVVRAESRWPVTLMRSGTALPRRTSAHLLRARLRKWRVGQAESTFKTPDEADTCEYPAESCRIVERDPFAIAKFPFWLI
jgi:hypothetical protein